VVVSIQIHAQFVRGRMLVRICLTVIVVAIVVFVVYPKGQAFAGKALGRYKKIYKHRLTTVINSPVPSPTTASSPTPVPSPSIKPSPSATSSPVGSWPLQSVSTMKETKDRVCSPRDIIFIDRWLSKAVEVGANYVSIETPYDNPSCASALTYTKLWISRARFKGLKIWHRHMPLAFEGIYSIAKNSQSSYLDVITNYIKNNPTLFAADDIFTPIPEPQNGGIQGITYCSEGVCQFRDASYFNQWLRDAITQSKQAFASIGLQDKIKIGYYGFDGFVAWGHNNPDWNGILEDSTVSAMGNITIDHYPELVGTSMTTDLAELEKRYPGVPIIIGEWGTVTGGTVEQAVKNSMGAAIRPSVRGFNYWHMGISGNEALINEDFTSRVQFDEVRSFFKR